VSGNLQILVDVWRSSAAIPRSAALAGVIPKVHVSSPQLSKVPWDHSSLCGLCQWFGQGAIFGLVCLLDASFLVTFCQSLDFCFDGGSCRFSGLVS
jgi:hypothetical protein